MAGRNRQNIALSEWNSKMGDEILRNKFYQFIFFNQWYALKNYCDSKDIKLIGDIPIYVNYDSADVWANPKIFNLDNDKNPAFVAGVPPDYFSSTGQLWGHPVYRWDVGTHGGLIEYGTISSFFTSFGLTTSGALSVTGK
jgi:4-alpha-glucanotransferase